MIYELESLNWMAKWKILCTVLENLIISDRVCLYTYKIFNEKQKNVKTKTQRMTFNLQIRAFCKIFSFCHL